MKKKGRRRPQVGKRIKPCPRLLAFFARPIHGLKRGKKKTPTERPTSTTLDKNEAQRKKKGGQAGPVPQRRRGGRHFSCVRGRAPLSSHRRGKSLKKPLHSLTSSSSPVTRKRVVRTSGEKRKGKIYHIISIPHLLPQRVEKKKEEGHSGPNIEV